MTKRFEAVGLLCLALALAGCAGAPPRDGAVSQQLPALAPDDVLPWALARCEYVVAWTYVDAQSLAPYLPEGFESRRAGRPSAALDGKEVMFGFDVVTCEEGETIGGIAEGMTYASYWADAAPPPHLVADGVDEREHYLKFDVLVPDEPRLDRLQARSAPVHSGSARLERDELQISDRIRASATMNEVGTFSVDGVATGALGRLAGTFIKYQVSDGGVFRWQATFEAEDVVTGTGTVVFDSLLARDIVGNDQATVSFHSGRWSYTNATIEVWPRASLTG